MSKMTVVNSWNEWDPLRHVIVGKADDCHIPPEEPALDKPTMGDVAASLEADIIQADPEDLNREIHAIKACGLSEQNSFGQPVSSQFQLFVREILLRSASAEVAWTELNDKHSIRIPGLERLDQSSKQLTHLRHRARKRFSVLFHEQLRQTVLDEEAFEDLCQRLESYLP